MDSDDSQLRNIFELCSPDQEGYILTEYLADKLAQQFSDPALAAVQDVLDPDRLGRISFEQFCHAVTTLQGKEAAQVTKPQVYVDDNDSSDPENTYNEYDIPEDEISEMENLEAIGGSPHLSPIKMHESSDSFRRNSSFRRSHRRVKSWTLKGIADTKPLESNDETSSVASEFEDLSEKIDKLQDHMTRLEEDKSLQSQYELLKQENYNLNNHIHELEEKLQDLTERYDEMKRSSQQRLENFQREHDLEIQVLKSKMDVLVSDKERLKSELDFTKNNAKESRESLLNMQSQSEVLTKQIMETNEEYRRLNKRISSQHDVHEVERGKLREEIEEAKRQLRVMEEENRKLKAEVADAQFDPNAARIRTHIDDLKAANEELKRNNEELTDQLTQQVSEARLLMCGGEVASIADELNHASRDEVMEALKKQEQINEQMRKYLERITLNILERNPEILEIK